MPDVVVLQRRIPHYRVDLFEQLFARFGWAIAASPDAKSPQGPAFYYYPMPEERRFGRTVVAVPLARILTELKPKAVIAEYSFKMTSTWDLIAGRWTRGLRILFWSHGYNMSRGFRTASDLAHQFMRGAVARLADGHVCYSEEGYQFLTRFVPRERLFIAHNTMKGPDPPPAVRPRSPGGPRLLSISRLTPGKSVDRLLAIFQSFKSRFPESRLTMVGGGTEIDFLRGLAEPLGDAVTFTGEITDHDRLAALFQAADCFVISGDAGLSVNHALLHGVPVVLFERCTDGPFHGPEHAYVQDGITGIRVKKHTDEAFVAALISLFTSSPDPKYQFHNAIHCFASKYLNIDRMIEDFGKVDLYLKALATQRGSSVDTQ